MAAAADARISTSLPTHPKTKKLIKRLGPASAWHLVVLFLFVAESKSDGDLSGMTDEDIELAADWSGDEGAFVEGLASVRFLDGEENARSIHDWVDHNPWAAGAAARSEKSRFAALTKQYGRGEAERQMPAYAARIRPAAPDDAGGKGRPSPEDANSTGNTANGVPVAVPDSATGSAAGTDGQCPVSDTVSVTVTVTDPVSVSVSASPQADSLRSSSSPAEPPTVQPVETDEQRKLRRAAAAADRLAAHTDNAMAAYNELLTSPNGVLSAATRIGIEGKRTNVKRCIGVAKEISTALYDSDTVTPEFWHQYFGEVKKDEFKSGRAKGGKGHGTWTPDFEYLTRKETMTEVFEKAMSEAES